MMNVPRHLHGHVGVQREILGLQGSELMSLLDESLRGAVEEIRRLPAAQFVVAGSRGLALGGAGTILDGCHPEEGPRPPQTVRVRSRTAVVDYLAAPQSHLKAY